MRAEIVEAETPARNPIRGIFFGCCAWVGTLSGRSMAQSARTVIFLFMSFSLPFHSTLLTRPSLLFDHFIRSHQHIGRNRQADLLGRIEVDHQLELCWLLDGYVSRLSPFENLVHLDGDAMK